MIKEGAGEGQGRGGEIKRTSLHECQNNKAKPSGRRAMRQPKVGETELGMKLT